MVERREQAILEGNPDLDHVVPVDTRLWRREFRRPVGAASVAVKLRGLVRRLARGRFDMAVDLQGLWKSGVITALTRAPLRVGLSSAHCRERASAWFTNRHVTPPREAEHVVHQYLAVAAGLGVDLAAVGPPAFPVPGDPEAEASMARWLEDEGVKPGALLTLLNPGSGGDHKRWAVEAFRRLGEELAVRLGGRVAITWGPGEEPLARAVAHGMRTGALVPPPTTIPEMVALFRRATLVVGGDTGPIHVASVLGVPTVGLYGPTSARRNGPLRPPRDRHPEPHRADGRHLGRRRPGGGAGSPPMSRDSAMPRISVAVVTLNEEDRLRACLESVVWAEELVVIDAGSSDKTVAIAREFTDRVQFRAWDGYGTQKNFAIGQCRGDWILSLDADERVSEALRKEIQATLEREPREAGFFVPRRNLFQGRWMRHGGLYPDRQLRLFRRGQGAFVERAVHESVRVEGPTGRLRTPLIHESYRSVADAVTRLNRYSELAAADLAAAGRGGSLADLLVRPAWRFVSMYLLRAGFLDGWRGLLLARLHAHYVFLRAAKVRELTSGRELA